MVIYLFPPLHDNNDSDSHSNRNMSNLEHTDHVVLLSENTSSLEVFLNCLVDSIGMFDMRCCNTQLAQRQTLFL